MVGVPAVAAGEVVTEELTYEHEGETFGGYLAYDKAKQGERPGVLVIHEWWGLDGYAKRRARMLASLGYVAYAPDMYGEDEPTDDPSVASNWAGHLRGDVDLWRGRTQAALEQLKARDRAHGERVAAIGYCFGGATVLHLAYSGADVEAVVSFHGGFPEPADETMVEPTVLVCHGAQDGHAAREEVAAWQQQMDEVEADWQMVTYARAEHSFTNPAADERDIPGIGYDEKADERSWALMQRFLSRQLQLKNHE